MKNTGVRSHFSHDVDDVANGGVPSLERYQNSKFLIRTSSTHLSTKECDTNRMMLHQ